VLSVIISTYRKCEGRQCLRIGGSITIRCMELDIEFVITLLHNVIILKGK
jgi:hypothetical protein